MPRRVAGTIWAIRITMDISREDEVLFKIPNTVCVYHAGGKRARNQFKEKPHYHLYYDAGVEVTKETVQDMVRSNEIVKRHYKASNGFWSVETSPEYDLESYWRYVWSDFPEKKQRLIWWDIEVPQLPDYPVPEIPLVVAPGPLDPYRGTGNQIIYVKQPKAKTSLEKQQAFYAYCKEYYGRKEERPTSQMVCYLLVKYCEEKGFTPESSLSTWARFAYLNLLDKPERRIARSELSGRLHEKFF